MTTKHFVSIDCSTDELSIDFDTRESHENGVPAKVWHGIVSRFHIPNLKSAARASLIEEITDAAERLRTGTEIVWDGSNHVGRANDDARDAAEEITLACEASDRPGDVVCVWDAADWFGPCSARELGITANMSDEALAAKIEELEAEARANVECDELHGAAKYLTNLRNDLRDRAEASA